MGCVGGRGGGEGGERTRKTNSSSAAMWEGAGDGQSREEHLQGALPWARWLFAPP